MSRQNTEQVDHLVKSACGHPQEPPTAQEIAGCPEVIVRRCIVCDRELWWNIDQWRRF